MPRSKDAVLDYEFTRFNEGFRHKKRLARVSFYLLRDKGAVIGLRVMKLQINDQIIDFDKGADNSCHKLKLLKKGVLAYLIEFQ